MKCRSIISKILPYCHQMCKHSLNQIVCCGNDSAYCKFCGFKNNYLLIECNEHYYSEQVSFKKEKRCEK